MDENKESIPSNESAERYFERAALAMQSRLMSSSDCNDTALELAKKAFDLNPDDPRYISLLYEICIPRMQSLFEIGVTREQFKRAFSNKQAADHIHMRIENFLAEMTDPADARKGESRPLHTKLVLETLEEIIKIDPQPFVLRRLYYVYRYIGRAREALKLMFQAAEMDVEGSGPFYIHACFNLHRYDDIVEYSEKHKDTLWPLLNDEIKIMLALAYERRCDKVTACKNFKLEDESEFREGYEYLKRAEELYKENHEQSQPEVTGERYPTTDEMIDTINYGQIFTQQALLLDHNRHFDTTLPSSTELRKKAIQILEGAINRIGDERARFQQWKEVVGRAKMQLVSASCDEGLGEDSLKRAIQMGRELMDDPDSKSLPRYDALPNNLVNLIALECKMTGTDEPKEEFERLFIESFICNWEDPLSYRPLIDFYAENKDSGRAHMFQAFLEISFLLRYLIDLDRWQEEEREIVSGHHMDMPEFSPDCALDFQDQVEGIYERVREADIAIRDYLKPLHRAIDPYLKKYHDFLVSIAPPGTEVIQREKDIYSTILKMLKEEKEVVTDITDMIGFRVLTDTEDQAREVYAKVRAYIKDDPKPKEWLTFDKPSKRGYSSLDITGYTKEDDVRVQIQVRTKTKEKDINVTQAHHDFYKQKSGHELERKVRKDPLRYLTLLYIIPARLGAAYRDISEKDGELDIHEVIRIYEDAVPYGFEGLAAGLEDE